MCGGSTQRRNPLSLQAICDFRPPRVISATLKIGTVMMTVERRIVVLLGCLWILPIAPAGSDSFTPALEGYRYQFPRDHGSHDRFRTEWWYYTGNLTAKDGRAFGYQLTFFRRAMPADQIETLPSKWSATQLYLAHFAISDLKKDRKSVV